MELAKFSPQVLTARDVPAGSMVLSLSGVDREELRAGMMAYAAAIFAAGVATGYLWHRSRTPKRTRR